MKETAAILVGAQNSVSVTGSPWSWWLKHADELAIPIVKIGTKCFAKASDVLDAVEKRRASTMVDVSEPLDDLAAFRERIRRVS